MSKQNEKNIELYIQHYLDGEEAKAYQPLRMQIHIEDEN